MAEKHGFTVWEPLGRQKHFRVLKYTSAESLVQAGNDFGAHFQDWVRAAVADVVPVLKTAHERLK